MKLVFCGTPQFAVPTLEAVIAAGHEVALVMTQPDRAAGRGMEVQNSPVKQFAVDRGIPVVQPEKIKNNIELRAQLEAIAPDVILVVAYGRIIPQWMLELPRFGNVNLHGSFLPKYRGGGPIQWAGGKQDHGVATLGPILEREDGWIDFSRTAKETYDRWRGFQPWPGAHTILRGKKLIVQKMHVRDGAAGEVGVLVVHGGALLVGCGERTVLGLDEVQMEGKRRMNAA